jgi:hypothetical protein
MEVYQNDRQHHKLMPQQILTSQLIFKQAKLAIHAPHNLRCKHLVHMLLIVDRVIFTIKPASTNTQRMVTVTSHQHPPTKTSLSAKPTQHHI